MTEDLNDKIPSDNKLPVSLDEHLRAILPDKNIKQFSDQLPAEFISDATEGLGQMKDTKHLESVLQQLNQQMHLQLGHKKIHKRSTSVGDLSWTYWAIIIILLLCIVSFVVVRMLLKR
jgi:hypothetical protein